MGSPPVLVWIRRRPNGDVMGTRSAAGIGPDAATRPFSTITKGPEASVADHPGTRSREAFRAAPGFLHKAGRLARAAPAAWRMRGLVFTDRLRRVGAAFVGGVGPALVGRHAEEVRRR